MEKSLKNYKIILAEDDVDDCNSFRESLEELKFPGSISIVHNGEQLMEMLKITEKYPDLIFLDLNMPLKNGFQCLEEIKQDEKIRMIPIIIISTTMDKNSINRLYNGGAAHFIQKPADFTQLTQLISQAITFAAMPRAGKASMEKFVILPKA